MVFILNPLFFILNPFFILFYAPLLHTELCAPFFFYSPPFFYYSRPFSFYYGHGPAARPAAGSLAAASDDTVLQAPPVVVALLRPLTAKAPSMVKP